MRKTVVFSLIIFLMVWIVSCGPPGSIFQDEEELQVELETIPSGSFITENTPIPLSIVPVEEGAYPDKLEITLTNWEGKVLSTDTMEGEELTGETLPDLYMPPMEPGLYVLDLSLFDGEMLIGEKTAQFFFVPGIYAIQGISSFPPVIAPSSTALFNLNLTMPAAADPYIVWSVGSTILSTRHFSEGGDELQWEVPETEGVYAITAEVYPESPVSGVTFPFESQQSMSAEVFVTSNISRSDDELGPESSYWTLFHFRGNLNDASEFGIERKIFPNESAEFAVKGGIFGFSLDDESGFTVPELLIPVENETLKPFSLSLRLLLTENSPGGSLIQMNSGDRGFSFELGIDEDGQVGIQTVSGSVETVVDSGETVLQTGVVQSVTVSLHPVLGGIHIDLFMNGLKTGEGIAPVPDISSGTAGSTRVGGDSGYSGVVDELGVYYSNKAGEFEVDPDIYQRGAAEFYGDDLLYAEGFDGFSLPENLKYEGDAEVRGGFLEVSDEGSVELPELEFSYENLVTEIGVAGYSALGKTIFSLVNSNGSEEMFTINAAGDGVLSSGESFQIVPDGSSVRIILVHDESGIFLVTKNGSILLYTDPENSSVISIHVENTDSEAILLIDRILVYTENPNLVKEKSQSPEGDQETGEPVNV